MQNRESICSLWLAERFSPDLCLAKLARLRLCKNDHHRNPEKLGGIFAQLFAYIKLESVSRDDVMASDCLEDVVFSSVSPRDGVQTFGASTSTIKSSVVKSCDMLVFKDFTSLKPPLGWLSEIGGNTVEDTTWFSEELDGNCGSLSSPFLAHYKFY